MNVHEYQAKALLAERGAAVPRGRIAYTAEEAEEAARELGGPVWVVKAQIHAGGRGKAGGVKVARSVEEAAAAARAMLGMTLVTPQTGPEGCEVSRVYVEEGCDIARELYLGVLLDRAVGRVAIVASTEGGMDIEQVAAETPERIFRVHIDPLTGVRSFHTARLARRLGLEGAAAEAAARTIAAVYDASVALDATLLEINPLAVTADGAVLALDAKANFDDNALYRRPEIARLRDEGEEDPREREAARHDLNYVKLDGNIGCMVNGAGLAMATMDIVKLYGGAPANFLDVGGGASGERVTEAFKLILSDPDVEGVLVNIFGGIMRCDTIAEGVVEAARAVSLHVPLVVRLEGTNVEVGKRILAESGLPVVSAGDLDDAARKIVQAVEDAS